MRWSSDRRSRHQSLQQLGQSSKNPSAIGYVATGAVAGAVSLSLERCCCGKDHSSRHF
ncbi:MAG: hypothetical protein IPJ13_23750 [Saprospiraceae bacterium]|nr:hypothetical protein [Saprospiraceae bacterium]